MLSAVGHLGYCRFQQKMIKPRASMRWEMGTGRSFTGRLFSMREIISAALFHLNLPGSKLPALVAVLYILNYS